MIALSSTSGQVAKAAELITQSNQIVAFTGAGISTPSGIPDFRNAESGLWTHDDPMTVASIFGFRKDPKPFFEWVRPLAQKTWEAHPNAAHYALKRLETLNKMHSIVTQNIDMLHTRAGNECVYELHGSMKSATCIECHKVHHSEAIMRDFITTGEIPHCDCARQAVLKPNVILFGEQLPYQALQGAKKAIRNSDLLLIIGSSLEVAPASDLPLLAKRSGAKVIMINLDRTDLDRMADIRIYEDAAQVLPAIVNQVEKSL